ncbi:methyltransferase family protein [Albidovulum sp.]
MVKDVDFPPVWLAGFALAGYLLGRIFPVHLAANDYIGAVLVVIALIIAVLSVLQMLLSRTTVVPRREPSALVTRGLFAQTRNPIYLADTILLAGLYFAWDALVALPLALIFMEVIKRRFILDEERRLLARFGDAFEDYCARTRRWL